MPTDPARVQELFLAALDLPDEAARAARLDAACGGDAELRRRVEALLRAHARPDSLLDAPVVPPPGGDAPTRTVTPDALAGGPDAGEGFELGDEIGRGANGVVFRARQRGLNRVVAVKMALGPGRAARQSLARFLAEAEAVAAISHPHVVRVYGFGQRDGVPYLAMEYLPGGTLADRLRAGPLAPREAAGLMAKVASGVAAAHAQGIVHRDLKPGNVLLDEAGEPKVTDFGLARRGPGSDLTATHAVMGTPAYMAPEQARGGGKFAGPQADVWALGVMLYEGVAGARPFDGDSDEALLARVASAEAPPLRSRAKGVPRDLDTVVAKCLSSDPGHRYPTAAELAADLGRFARGEPISARPVGRAERLYRWARRKPTAAAAYGLGSLAAALALVVFVVAGLWREAEGAKEETQTALDALEIARRAEEAARLAAERERERVAVIEYGRAVQLAHQAWRDGDPAGGVRILDGTRERHRGWEWHYVRRLCTPAALHTVPGARLAPDPGSSHWSPDGTRFAVVSGETVRVVNAATGREVAALDGGAKAADGGVRSVAFSPDGARLLTRTYTTARLWDPATGRLVAELGGVGDLTWSRDGSRVLGVCYIAEPNRVATAARVRRWDARTGAELPTRGPGGADTLPLRHPYGTVLWSPDGALLAVAAEVRLFLFVRGEVRVYDAATGEQKLRLPGGWEVWKAWGVRGQTVVAWSPDGGRLLTGDGARSAYDLWDARTGERLPLQWAVSDTSASEGAELLRVNFSDDGRRMAVPGTNSARLRVWDPDGRNEAAPAPAGVHRVNPSPKGDLAVAVLHDGSTRMLDLRTGEEAGAWKGRRPPHYSHWSPDGAWVATGSVVWEAATGREVLAHSRPGAVLGWSPDGGKLVTSSTDNTAVVWDVPSGRSVVLKGHARPVRAAAWAPDGKRLLTVGEDRATARVWDAETGAELAALPSVLPERFDTPAWSPDGHRLVLAAADQKVRDGRRAAYVVWDAATWKPTHTFLVAENGFALPPVWGPDGKRLVFASAGFGLGVWDTATWAEVAVLKTHDLWGVSRVAWSPSGHRVLTTGRSDVSVWDPATGAHLAHLAVPSGAVVAATWHPDGRRVLTESNERVDARPEGPDPGAGTAWHDRVRVARVWDADSGTLRGTLADISAESEPPAASWSPDGTRLLVYHREPAAAVFDAATGTRLAELPARRTWRVGAVPSPDGTRVLTVSALGEPKVRVWDVATGTQTAVLEGHAHAVTSAEWSRDGARVVTTSEDRTARIWDAATGKQLARLSWTTGDGNPLRKECGGLSPDGTRFLSPTGAGVEVWDVRAPHPGLRSPGHTGTLGPEVGVDRPGRIGRSVFPGGGLAWSRDGTRLVTGGADGTVRMWDSATGREVGVLWRHAGAVTAVAFSPSGREFVTASADGTARVWDGRTGRLLGALDGHRAALTGAAFSPDGRWVVTTATDGTARVWDTPPGGLPPRRPVAVLDHLGASAEMFNEFTSAAWSPRGDRLAVGGEGGSTRVWDTRTWKSVGALHTYPPRTGVSWSPRGDRILLTPRLRVGGYEYRHNVIAYDAGTLVRVWSSDTPDDPTGTAWSPDGRQLLVAGTESLRDADTGKVVTQFKGGAGDDGHPKYRFASFRPDGARALTGSGAGCWIRDVADGKMVCELRVSGWPQVRFTGAAWSPDGARVATGHTDGSVRVWDAATGRVLATMPPAPTSGVTSAAWHPGGRWVLTVGPDPHAWVWDAATGARVAPVPLRDGKPDPAATWPDGTAVRWEPTRYRVPWPGGDPEETAKGEVLATAADGSRVLWVGGHRAEVRAAARGVAVALTGHAGEVTGGAFSPDGSRVVTRGRDDTVRVWHAETGAELVVLKREVKALAGERVETNSNAEARSRFVSWSPDGHRVLTTALTRDVTVLDATPLGR